MKRIISTFVALLVAASPVAGQDLVRTVSGVDRGTVRASYATRPGTCGHEDNVQFGTNRTVINGRWNDRRCVEGPAFLQLEIIDGRVDEAEVRVGVESWPQAGRGPQAGPVPADFGGQTGPDHLRGLQRLPRRPSGKGWRWQRPRANCRPRRAFPASAGQRCARNMRTCSARPIAMPR